MSIAECAQQVHRADPDRFVAVMSAPIKQREILFPLLAFNLEVARAAWGASEMMIAQMRLQWWLDQLDAIYGGKDPRGHYILTPLAQIIRQHNLPQQRFDGLIKAREWDIFADPHDDLAALERYIDQTSGNLMGLCAAALGADQGSDDDLVVQYGNGVGMANYLGAVHALEGAQKQPLIDRQPSAIKALAQSALTQTQRAKAQIGRKPPYLSALRLGWMALPMLHRAIAQPDRVLTGNLRSGAFWHKTRFNVIYLLGRY